MCSKIGISLLVEPKLASNGEGDSDREISSDNKNSAKFGSFSRAGPKELRCYIKTTMDTKF